MNFTICLIRYVGQIIRKLKTALIFTILASNSAIAANNPKSLGQTIPCLDKKTNKIILKGKAIADYKPKKDGEVNNNKGKYIYDKSKSDNNNIKENKASKLANTVAPPQNTPQYATCPPPPFDPDKVVGFGARSRAKYGKNAAVEIYSMRQEKPIETHQSFVAWLNRNPNKFKLANEYLAYLNSQGVGNVVPMRSLMLGCAINPNRDDLIYDVPPRETWKNIVPTLQFLRDYVVPNIGTIRLYHGYRNPRANQACGSTSDAHPNNTAIDIVPMKMDNPAQIERKMCKVFRQYGKQYNIGMGFYGTGLLHIDSWKTRSWGGDRSAATSPCLP
jgi:hypothetical protein